MTRITVGVENMAEGKLLPCDVCGELAGYYDATNCTECASFVCTECHVEKSCCWEIEEAICQAMDKRQGMLLARTAARLMAAYKLATRERDQLRQEVDMNRGEIN